MSDLHAVDGLPGTPSVAVPCFAIAEATWVLAAVYDRDRAAIAIAVDMLLNHEQLTVQDSEIVEALGTDKMRAHNRRHGAGDDQFGARLGDIRKLAATIRTNHELALALWNTGNYEARLLAVLLIKPKSLSVAQVAPVGARGRCGTGRTLAQRVRVKNHPDKETLRQAWMADPHPWAARAEWSLTSGRIASSPKGLDLSALLARIESEMRTAAPIGIHFPAHRARALAIGEALGIYRDYPVSKGCTTPFAPIWINEMVRRKS